MIRRNLERIKILLLTGPTRDLIGYMAYLEATYTRG